MLRTNTITAALTAVLVLPTVAIASDGDPASTLQSRDGSPREQRTARAAPIRTGEEARFEGRDTEASGRADGERGVSIRRDGNGEASFDQLGDQGQGRGGETMTPFRHTFDLDDDGALSTEERAKLDKALVAYHRSLRQGADADRDGRLGDRDWQAFLQSTYGEHAEWHVARDRRWIESIRSRHDADGDGTLDEAERATMAAVVDRHRMFQLEHFDRDADGTLGERELAFIRARAAVATLDNVGGTRFRTTVKRRAFGTQAGSGSGEEAGESIRSVRARGDRP